MKVFDRLTLMNDSSLAKPSSSSKDLSNNDDEPDSQEVLISEASICQMIRIRLNRLKNERRQNVNHQKMFSITILLLNLQQQRNDVIKKINVYISLCNFI